MSPTAANTVSAAVELRLGATAEPTEADQSSLLAVIQNEFVGKEIKNFKLTFYTARRGRERRRGRNLLAIFWVMTFDVVTSSSVATTSLDLVEEVTAALNSDAFETSVTAAATSVTDVEVQTVVAATRHPTTKPSITPTPKRFSDVDDTVQLGPIEASSQLLIGAGVATVLLIVGALLLRRFCRWALGQRKRNESCDGESPESDIPERIVDDEAPLSPPKQPRNIKMPPKTVAPRRNQSRYVDPVEEENLHGDDLHDLSMLPTPKFGFNFDDPKISSNADEVASRSVSRQRAPSTDKVPFRTREVSRSSESSGTVASIRSDSVGIKADKQRSRKVSLDSLVDVGRRPPSGSLKGRRRNERRLGTPAGSNNRTPLRVRGTRLDSTFSDEVEPQVDALRARNQSLESQLAALQSVDL